MNKIFKAIGISFLLSFTLLFCQIDQVRATPTAPSYHVFNTAVADGTAVTTVPNPTGLSTASDGNGGFMPNGFTSTFNSANLATTVAGNAVTAQTVNVTSQSTAYGFSTSGRLVTASASPNIVGSFTPVNGGHCNHDTSYSNAANIVSTAQFSGTGATGWTQVQAQGTLTSVLSPSGFMNTQNLIGSATSFVSGARSVTGGVTSVLSGVSAVNVNH